MKYSQDMRVRRIEAEKKKKGENKIIDRNGFRERENKREKEGEDLPAWRTPETS